MNFSKRNKLLKRGEEINVSLILIYEKENLGGNEVGGVDHSSFYAIVYKCISMWTEFIYTTD